AIGARYGDEPTCAAREASACQQRLLAPANTATPTRTTACATAVQAATCSDWIVSNLGADCLPAAGSIGDGLPCGFSGQCSSAFCLVGPDTTCGKCGAAPKIGDSCASTFCNVGQSCLTPSATCEVLGGSGASCDGNNPCAYGFACTGATGSKTCQVAGKVGDACDPKGNSAPTCDRTLGFWCPGTLPTKCVTIAFTVPAGGSCGRQTDGSYAGCAPGASCEGATSTAAGLCVTLAKDGAACDSAKGPSCEAPARCNPTGTGVTTGTCAIPDGTCGLGV
ncbi:MAG: hypothetical protein ACHREM_21230, partial [Polyangiales bacterium]